MLTHTWLQKGYWLDVVHIALLTGTVVANSAHILYASMQDVNNRLKEVCSQRGLPVLSFGEGIPTTINNMLPKLTVSSPYVTCQCMFWYEQSEPPDIVTVTHSVAVLQPDSV